MSLESKHYVATAEDVARITREVLEAHKKRSSGVATYLSSLIATTIAELGEQPRQRAPGSTPGKLSTEEIAEQVAALEKVDERFYAVVKKTAKDLIEVPDRGGLLLNRRTAFARSSRSMLMKWVRHGRDITRLVPGHTTKAMLYIPGKRKGPSVKVLGNRMAKHTELLEQTLSTFAQADADAAREQWMRLKVRMERIFARRTGTTVRVHERRAAA